MSTTTPPGWYPDTTTPGQQRWWDGSQWTAQTQAPYQSAAPYQANTSDLRAPEGTPPYTWQIWAIVALFVLQMTLGLVYLLTFDFVGYMRATMELPFSDSGSASSLALFGYLFTPTYFATIAVSFLGYVGTIVLAYSDSRALAARGVPRPFPWALSFIPSYGAMVYVIGRSVVVRRRTGTGLAPMWIFIAAFVVSLVLSVVVGFAMMGSMMSELSTLPLYGY